MFSQLENKQPTTQSQIYTDGFTAIRHGIFDHLRDGRMHPTMLAIYVLILHQCDWRSGLWLGSAYRVFDSFGQTIELRTIRDNLKRLYKSGYLKSFRKKGRRGNYYVAINKYRPTVGVLRGRQLNTDKSTSPKDLFYEVRSEDVVTASQECTDDAVTVQRRCTLSRYTRCSSL